MILGVPKHSLGGDCNGKVVVVREITIKNIWRFEPAVTSKISGAPTLLEYGEERFLHPLDPCEDDLRREQLDEVIQRTFTEALQRELEKL